MEKHRFADIRNLPLFRRKAPPDNPLMMPAGMGEDKSDLALRGFYQALERRMRITSVLQLGQLILLGVIAYLLYRG